MVAKTYRIFVDLPMDSAEFLQKESARTTISIKAICQKILVEHIKNKSERGEPLI